MAISQSSLRLPTQTIGMPGNVQTAFTAVRPGVIASAVLQAFTSGPLGRKTDYAANYAWPNVIPPPDQLISAWSGGGLGDAALQQLLWFHGIDWTNIVTRGPANDPITRAWQTIVNNHRASFDLGFYLQQYRRDNTQLPLLVDVLKRHGIGDPSEQGRYYSNYEDLPVGVWITLRHYGYLTDAEFYAAVAKLGIRQEDAERLLQAHVNRPDAATSRMLVNMGIIGIDTFIDNLNSAGITEPTSQAIQIALRNTLPSVGSVLGGQVNHAWDQQFALRWLMDAGTTPEWDTWADRLGYNFPAGQGPFGQPDLNAPTWKQILWRSHWQWPGIAQWMQVMHRYRGDPNNPATWSVPGIVPPQLSTLSEVMTGLGVVPGAQPYIAGLLYSPMPIRLLRYVVQTQNPPKAWISGKLQDSGYSPPDSDIMAQSLIDAATQQQQQPLIQLRKRTWSRFVQTVVDGYRDGSMSNAAATAALAGQGIDAPTIATMLATADIEVNDGIVKAVVSRARSDWFAGRTNLAGATQRLLSAGMDAKRVSQITASWQAERGEGRVVLATNKVLSLLRNGFITMDEAIIRLDNLNWSKPDEVLLLAEVQAEIHADAAKAAAAADLAKQKSIREMERLLKENQSRAERIRREMERQTPVASILKWIRDGIMTETAARQRLDLLGYTKDAVDAMIREDKILIAQGKTPTAESKRQSLELQRRLFPPSRVIKYYIDGVWTRAQAERKLLDLDYTPAAIAPMLADADTHKKP